MKDPPLKTKCGNLRVTAFLAFCFLGVVHTFEFFSECLHSASECADRASGQYPVCGNCHLFVLCTATRSLVDSCPLELHYDFGRGKCDREGKALCGHENVPAGDKSGVSTLGGPSTVATTTQTIDFPQFPFTASKARQAASVDVETNPPITAATLPQPITDSTDNPAPSTCDLPTMSAAESVCTRTTFICEEGFVWQGPQPQSVEFNAHTMTWGTPHGMCVRQGEGNGETDQTYPVPPTEGVFGVCLTAEAMNATSKGVVSLMSGEDAVLRFTIDYSCNDTILGSEIDGTELYHIFLNTDPATFLDPELPFSINVIETNSDSLGAFLISDGTARYFGTLRGLIYHPSLTLCNIDRVTVTGDLKVTVFDPACIKN